MVVLASRSKAFGLIDLIFVMALLAILVGLFMPAVYSALEQANRAACMANLKQIGSAFKTWATDHRQRWPDVFTEESERWHNVGNTRTDQWDGLNNKDEPPAAEPDDNGEPIQSNTANFWHLIANAGFTIDCFLCPSADHLRDATVIHFDRVRDFRGLRFVSYSYQNVLGAYTLTQTGAEQPSAMVVAADANPMRRDSWSGAPGGAKEGVTDKHFGTFVPTDETKPWRSAGARPNTWELNSPNHNFEGQNVLYLDGHIEWRCHPYCGTKFDNIWLRRRTDVTTEPDPTKIEALRAYNDTASYDGTSTLPPGTFDDSFLVP